MQPRRTKRLTISGPQAEWLAAAIRQGVVRITAAATVVVARRARRAGKEG